MKTLNDIAKEHREFSAYEPSETVYADTTTHMHSWKKTMDLRCRKDVVSVDYMIPVVLRIEQRSICIECGEEAWFEVEEQENEYECEHDSFNS